MLASACPGWVCYAEKTHAAVLPNVSTAKSPQVYAVHRSFPGCRWHVSAWQTHALAPTPVSYQFSESEKQLFRDRQTVNSRDASRLLCRR